MITLSLLPNGRQQFIDANGNPLVGGTVGTYIPGTLTPKTTYSDQAGTLSNANPITLDALGSAVFWGDGLFRQIVKNAAGAVVWDSVTGYDWTTTLGSYALKDLTNVTEADFSGKVFSVPGGTTDTGLANRFSSLLSLQSDFGASAANADNTSQIQNAFTYCRANNKSLRTSAGLMQFATGLTINNTTHTDKAFIFSGEGASADSSQGGSWLQYTGTSGDAIAIIGTTADNQDGTFELRNFGIRGAGQGNSAGAHNIHGELLNATVFYNVFSSYSGGHGFYGTLCFSMDIDNGLYFSNYGNGIFLDRAANRVHLVDIRAYGNGRNVGTVDQGNIFFYGGGNPNLGPVIENCDVSYSGRVLFNWAGSSGAAQMSSISCTAGVATVTTVAAHGLSTGNKISVTLGATPGISGGFYGKNITVIDSTHFTYPAAGLANGVYDVTTDPALRIGTHSTGLFLGGCKGALVTSIYCEDPNGIAVYVGADSNSIILDGGYIQNGYIVVDTATNVSIRGIAFAGIEAGLVTSEANLRPTIDVDYDSCTWSSGATWSHGVYFKKGGVMYGNAVPASGTWLLGDEVVRSPPVVGQPISWKCTVAGSPGTWVSTGNL